MPNLPKFRKATLTIDSEPVEVRVTRLKLEEAEAYRERLRVLMSAHAESGVLSTDEVAFVRQSFETYLSLAPGALSIDGEFLTTGAQLLDVVGESPRAVLLALLAISGTSVASDAEGKRSASESTSVPSSDGHDQAPDGRRPAPTAGDVAPAGTAPIGAVTGETDTPSSGPTATSS